MQWILVGVGGALGSVLRFFLQGKIQLSFPGVFPLGTFVVNMLGSWAIGFLAGVFEIMPASPRLTNFLMAGVLGGFTTFSSFSAQNLMLVRAGQGRVALVYVLASNVLGIGGAFI